MTKSQDPMSPVKIYSKLLKDSLVRATTEKNTQRICKDVSSPMAEGVANNNLWRILLYFVQKVNL